MLINNQEIKVKKLTENAIIPTRGSDAAAGYDLYFADLDVTIEPHTTAKLGTGLAFELPECTFAAIFARSGLATKQGLRPANCVGVCDSDYRGEYIVAIHNDTNEPKTIKSGERIAQMIIAKVEQAEIQVEVELTETIRGAGGFGSTGK